VRASSLSVDPQRPARAAGQNVVEHEVESEQVGDFESFTRDGPSDGGNTRAPRPRRGSLSTRIARRRVGDDGDVRVVALVAAAAVRDRAEGDDGA